MTVVTRVGIIGANPDRGWGSGVHRRAIELLPDFTLSAVCTTRRESAETAARRFDAAHAFVAPEKLVRCADVDVVAICVLAPHHHMLARMAIDAGKAVYCEWPLGTSMVQARELSAMAEDRGVASCSGLQMRALPAMRYARALIGSGAIGTVETVNAVMRRPGMPDRVPASMLAMVQRKYGTTTQTIHLAHVIDALRYICGPVATVQAEVVRHQSSVEISETGERIEKDTPDQVMAIGLLTNDAAYTLDVASLMGAGVGGMDLRISGGGGTLRIRTPADAIGSFATFELLLSRPGEGERRLSIPAEYDGGVVPLNQPPVDAYPGVPVPRETLIATASLYRTLVDASELDDPPDFAVGMELINLLDAVDQSAVTGRRAILV